MITKIISGGQTGADRAALDAAIELDIPHGGWIPRGRKTEEGPLDERYQLQEIPSESYPKRTEKNILDSDGTLIVTHGRLTGGSLLTREIAEKHKRPCLHVDMRDMSIEAAADRINSWLVKNTIEVLNVAGPRASKDTTIYETVKTLLTEVLGKTHNRC